MNHNDIIEFDGKDLTVEDVLKKQNKVILLQLYIKTQTLDSRSKEVSENIKDIGTKIDNQWAKISKNSTVIGYLKGILVFLIPVILGIIGCLAYTR